MYRLPPQTRRRFHDLKDKLFPVLSEGYWYGDYDKEKYKQYKFWHDGLGNKLTLGVSSTLIDNDIDTQRRKLYLDVHRLDYDDIVDPRNMPDGTTGSPGVAMLNFVSENYRKLYR